MISCFSCLVRGDCSLNKNFSLMLPEQVLTHCWDLNWCTGQSNFSITSNITFSSDS